MNVPQIAIVDDLEMQAWGGLPQPVTGMLPNDLKSDDVPDPALAFVIAVSRVLAARAEDAWPVGNDRTGPLPRLEDSSTVRRFRSKHLPEGQLLQPEEVEGWILEQAAWDARAGAPTEWYQIWIQPEDIYRREGDALLLQPHAKVHVEGVKEHRVVEYATPASPNREQPVRAGGVLYSLWLHTQDLSRKYEWTPAQSTLYILTGLAPIAATYATKMIGEQNLRPKAMSSKHLQLAEFTAEHLHEPLAERMAIWNERYPEWAYRTVSHFGGDSVLALRRTEGGQEKKRARAK